MKKLWDEFVKKNFQKFTNSNWNIQLSLTHWWVTYLLRLSLFDATISLLCSMFYIFFLFVDLSFIFKIMTNNIFFPELWIVVFTSYENNVTKIIILCLIHVIKLWSYMSKLKIEFNYINIWNLKSWLLNIQVFNYFLTEGESEAHTQGVSLIELKTCIV